VLKTCAGLVCTGGFDLHLKAWDHRQGSGVFSVDCQLEDIIWNMTSVKDITQLLTGMASPTFCREVSTNRQCLPSLGLWTQAI
jgi:hypothetical protein